MYLESASNLLVRASEILDRALFALPATAALVGLTRVVAGAAVGETPHRAPLAPPAELPAETARAADRWAQAQRLAVLDDPSRARPATPLVDQYDDGHFTGEDTAAACTCETNRLCRALYLHREGYRQLADWPLVASGLGDYNRTPRYARRDWLASKRPEADAVRGYFALLEYVEAAEARCPAASHYNGLELDYSLGNPHIGDVEKRAADNQAFWHDTEWRRLAWPLVAFQHHYRDGQCYVIRGDGDRGYRADPTNIAPETTLEAEYHLPRTVTVTEYVRDKESRYVLVDKQGSKITRRRTVIRSGEVHREYRRRDWCGANGRMYLPFLSLNLFRHHDQFLWVADRKRLHRRNQRRAIARLVRELGGDPKAPEVGTWVAKHGYGEALTLLRARARREGVALYA
jgi:hypothetical protein